MVKAAKTRISTTTKNINQKRHEMCRRNVCGVCVCVCMLKPELDTFLPFMDTVLHLTTTAKYTHPFSTSRHSTQKRPIRTNKAVLSPRSDFTIAHTMVKSIDAKHDERKRKPKPK